MKTTLDWMPTGNIVQALWSLTVAVAAICLIHRSPAQTTYEQATTDRFAPGTNIIEKSATAYPDDMVSFSNAVIAAYAANAGGVFDLPTGVASGTTVYRGTFGRGNTRRLVLTSSVSMQNVTATGTFIPVSGTNATTSSADQSGYRIRIGPVLDAATDLPVAEEVKRIGFVVLSRTHGTYPCDIRATVFFSDGTTTRATATVGNPKGSDDTFFGFTAPEGSAITNLLLESFLTGTTTPVSTRICWDDFGFITGPAYVAPPPVVHNISPAAYAMHAASNGIQFQVQSVVPLEPGNILLRLNSEDVSAQLIITGEPTNRLVAFFGLLPGQEYTMTITATNEGGSTTVSRTFYTGGFTAYDSEGFSDDLLYPLGPLQPVSHGRGTWTPNADEPAEIVDAGRPYGKVLQRLNTGIARADVLRFPPLSSGRILLEFDVLVSTTAGRTIDVALQPLSGGTTMASFLAWGAVPDKLCYYDNVQWVPLADLVAGWHHCKIVNHLSGPAAGRYDVFINDAPVRLRIPWRNATVGTPLGLFRYRSENVGPVMEYGLIDNLVITAAEEDPEAGLAPTILNLRPDDGAIVRPQAGIQFEVTSADPISVGHVTVLLDGLPVSLSATGTPNHLYVAYDEVLPTGNHTLEVYATNAVGTTTLTVTFIVADEEWMVHPAEGWASPWQWTSGRPQWRNESPTDGSGAYLRLDIAGTYRNFMRQYQSGANLDIGQPHYIRWKFRLVDDNFAANFTVFNDRVHFFGRNAPRLTGSTDASMNWGIMATGAEQTPGSGMCAGQTFWVFDNMDGTGAFSLANLVDTGVALIPHHIYSFSVRLNPGNQTYTVAITNETSGAWFQSAAPHRYRNLSVPGNTHTYLHFGVQASATDEPRSFDLDSVQIVQAALPVVLLNPQHSGSAFSFSFASQPGATYQVEYATALPPAQWYLLQTLVGDGTVKTVADPNPSGPQRYYRVRTQ
jgi:hypothetical protein